MKHLKFEFFCQLNWRNHVREHWLSSSLVIPKWSMEKPFFLKHSVAHGMFYFNEPLRSETKQEDCNY